MGDRREQGDLQGTEEVGRCGGLSTVGGGGGGQGWEA